MAKNDQETFGTLIKEAREGERLSLRAASHLCGLSHGYLGALEHNRAGSIPSTETLEKIARGFNLDISKLKRLAQEIEVEKKETSKHGREFERITIEAGLTFERGLQLYKEALKLFA